MTSNPRNDTEVKERWEVCSFPSGTVCVRRSGNRAYLDVGLRSVPFMTEDDIQRTKHQMADEICAFANGGDRPAWISDLDRTSECSLLGTQGESIIAMGPVYDAQPPRLDWNQCDDIDSQNARARLIDWLTGKRDNERD